MSIKTPPPTADGLCLVASMCDSSFWSFFSRDADQKGANGSWLAFDGELYGGGVGQISNVSSRDPNSESHSVVGSFTSRVG